jgi:hypothetical protein
MSVSGFDQDYVVQPGARPLYARPLGNIAAAMIGVIALLILGVALVVVGNRPVVEAQTDSATPEAAGGASVPESVAVVKQYAAFDLTSPEFAKEKKAVSTRQLDGGIREDNLTLGQFSSGEPYLRLDLRQPNGEKRANPDFFLDLTRHAAQAGLSVAKIGQPSPLSTRFGSFEVADIRLSQTSSQGAPTERACLAMRLAGAKLPVEIAGISCGAPAKPVDRRTLGCILDRLDYLPKGENKALDMYFLAAEQERGKGCGGAAMSPSASKSSWLDAHSGLPALKNEAPAAKHTKKAH